MARSAAYAGADGFSAGESPLRLSCGQLGAELEGQIEETLREFPSTGLIFIDTLQWCGTILPQRSMPMPRTTRICPA